jgi:L-lactate dehydrogenase complex protein LldG
MGATQGAAAVSSRETILAAIRRAAVPPAPAPAVRSGADASAALLEQFLKVLVTVGGMGVVRPAAQPVDQLLIQLLGDAHLDAVVLPGRFAVAENGAVYVDAADLLARTDIVRSEHLVLRVPVAELVPTMHEAVRRIPAGSVCGWFLSGPSKTADIEQALVIGAQGARTLHVIFDPA